VTGVEELPGGGHEADFTFGMLGRTRHGHVQDVELVPPNRRVFDVEGDADARTTYELTTEGRETLFVFMNEVEPPSSGVLGRLVGSVPGTERAGHGGEHEDGPRSEGRRPGQRLAVAAAMRKGEPVDTDGLPASRSAGASDARATPRRLPSGACGITIINN